MVKTGTSTLWSWIEGLEPSENVVESESPSLIVGFMYFQYYLKTRIISIFSQFLSSMLDSRSDILNDAVQDGVTVTCARKIFLYKLGLEANLG